jgi:acyl carrier protein
MSNATDTILDLLLAVAPEAADQQIDPDGDLRENLDIDSMDQLNFLIAVAETFGVEIPERDYSELVSLNAIARYVEARRADPPPSGGDR